MTVVTDISPGTARVLYPDPIKRDTEPGTALPFITSGITDEALKSVSQNDRQMIIRSIYVPANNGGPAFLESHDGTKLYLGFEPAAFPFTIPLDLLVTDGLRVTYSAGGNTMAFTLTYDLV